MLSTVDRDPAVYVRRECALGYGLWIVEGA